MDEWTVEDWGSELGKCEDNSQRSQGIWWGKPSSMVGGMDLLPPTHTTGYLGSGSKIPPSLSLGFLICKTRGFQQICNTPSPFILHELTAAMPTGSGPLFSPHAGSRCSLCWLHWTTVVSGQELHGHQKEVAGTLTGLSVKVII